MMNFESLSRSTVVFVMLLAMSVSVSPVAWAQIAPSPTPTLTTGADSYNDPYYKDPARMVPPSSTPSTEVDDWEESEGHVHEEVIAAADLELFQKVGAKHGVMVTQIPYPYGALEKGEIFVRIQSAKADLSAFWREIEQQKSAKDKDPARMVQPGEGSFTPSAVNDTGYNAPNLMSPPSDTGEALSPEIRQIIWDTLQPQYAGEMAPMRSPIPVP